MFPFHVAISILGWIHDVLNESLLVPTVVVPRRERRKDPECMFYTIFFGFDFKVVLCESPPLPLPVAPIISRPLHATQISDIHKLITT